MTVAATRTAWVSQVLTALTLSLLAAGWIVCLQPHVAPSAQQDSLNKIIGALRQRQPEALNLARQHLQAFPNDITGLALCAEVAASQSEHELAVSLFQRLPADGGRWEFHAQLGLARRYEILGRVALAERHLQRALELAPTHIEANNRLGYLLQIQGRTWESASHFFVQIQKGKCRGDELLGMATTERFFLLDERLERIALESVPQEVVMKLALARRALFENRSSNAETILREILSLRPDLGEAQGRLGRIIVDRDNFPEFLQWVAQLPEEARDHPEVCFVQGVQARRLGQMDGAVKCFLKVLASSPNHLGANVQIASCLERLGEADAAREFARRGEILAEFESTLNLVRNTVDPKLFAKAVALLGKLGRYWEAAGWCYVMTSLDIPQQPVRTDMRRWLALARAEPGPNAPSTLPVRLLKRLNYTSPRWPIPNATAPAGPSRTESPAAQSAIAWAFEDDAERLGIRFQYYEGTTEANRMQHIFNTMGGGLGAIDYDNDGWPDLYLAQANNWRNLAPQPEHQDRLYRNQLGERFLDVTAMSWLNEVSFSHGVTVGDYNQDGFADIYVGNKGPNRLYCNNGDGTFSDVTSVSGTASNEWTTSSVFADLNGDSLPDLYVLNYTLLKETAEKNCFSANGDPMACSPDLLISDADRCYLNLGDGSFRDISKDAGIDTTDGKGLGIVAWDFAGDGRLGIFVANDTTPNFLFMNQGLNPHGVPQFREEALVRGIALDSDGNALASMGVAAGDANGDGRIDLFVTTFFGESKVLFAQREDRFFDDLTRPFDLRNPGFWMLGFGCQFADLDGDGWEDLISTNGHVDQQSSKGDPDRMPPQVFQNLRGRRFAEIPQARLGKFFQGRYLGRGLAVLDWNRDGRTDVGISHLHAPVALLTNNTPAAGQPLVVRLIGRTGCREPTGASVRMKTKADDRLASPENTTDRKSTHGLPMETVRLQTGGDGFLVTNERRLHFSVPADQSVVDLEVRWPGGQTEQWIDVLAGQEILLIEGRQAPVSLREFPKP